MQHTSFIWNKKLHYAIHIFSLNNFFNTQIYVLHNEICQLFQKDTYEYNTRIYV